MSAAPGPDGLLVVAKPGGLTSHDVVAHARRLLGTRKVGHAGTLDPMATGVLLLGVGRGTRLLGHLALTDKRYDATVRLGAATTTDDADGSLLRRTPVDRVDEEALRAALAALTGEIDQVPSSVSAVKVDGRRAHARVRAGEDVVLPARRVTVHALDATWDEPQDGWLDVGVHVHCSTGTYVRALARDLGAALGVGGHLTALRRTAVGPVTLADARPLAEVTSADLWPLAQAAPRFFPTVTVDEAGARDVGVGRALRLDLPAAGPVAVLGPDGSLLALYGRAGAGTARPIAVLAPA